MKTRLASASTPLLPRADVPWHVGLAASAIVLAALAAYANTFSAPFVFDDKLAIVDNPSIRDLTDWRAVFSPPPGTAGAVGRPLVNLTLALNYAFGGLDVRGYHAVNLLIHVLAGLTLFGLVRRTLLTSGCGFQPQNHRRPFDKLRAVSQSNPEVCPPLAAPKTTRADATFLSFAIALLWTVHPLATESVTCVVQRNESLASLLILFTLYAFVRGIDCHLLNDNRSSAPEGKSAACHLIDDKPSGARRGQGARWFAVAAGASLLAMASKEIAVVGPVLVLLYDRTFVAGTFREAWRRHHSLYVALAAGWLLLAGLVVGAHGRNATVGFGEGVGASDYALTQCWAIPHYLALTFWPAPLVVDYGTFVIHSAREIALPVVVLGALLAASAWALVRRPAIGFLAAAFFLILAPSSSVLPLVTQTVAEHRMYLPLAAVIALLVLAVHALGGARALFLFLPVALALGAATFRRNADYRSELILWRDTAAKQPGNARAHNNLAGALARTGDSAGTLEHYEQAARLQPAFATARVNFATALRAVGRVPEAIVQYDEAVRLAPLVPDAWHNRGIALAVAGRFDDAIKSYDEALRLDPTSVESHRGLGTALAQVGRFADARMDYEIALRHDPMSPSLHGNLANVFFSLGQPAEAQSHYETALRLDPADADVHNNFGSLLLAQNHAAEALAEFREALRLRPDFPAARANLDHAQQILPGDPAPVRD